MELENMIHKVRGEKAAVQSQLEDLQDSMKDEIEEKGRFIAKVEEKEKNIKARLCPLACHLTTRCEWRLYILTFGTGLVCAGVGD